MDDELVCESCGFYGEIGDFEPAIINDGNRNVEKVFICPKCGSDEVVGDFDWE